MDENLKDNGQFRMRMDSEVDDNVIPSQVDELRIEKLSTKVTIISIIIPVLIVVVLTIAYLDMKKRVTRTQDTGTSGVENLSKDMESRFSNLSVRQANLDELIKKMNNDNNKALARIEVKLKKLEDASKGIKRTAASKSALESRTASLQKNIDSVAQSVETGNSQVQTVTQELKVEIAQINSAAIENQSNMAQINEKMTGLDQDKIDKAGLDLALKLEILKLKKTYKTQLDDINARIRRLERRPVPSPPKNPPAPKSSSDVKTPQPAAPAPDSGIVEQKIGK